MNIQPRSMVADSETELLTITRTGAPSIALLAKGGIHNRQIRTLSPEQGPGCPISRSFFARCGIPQRSTLRAFCLLDAESSGSWNPTSREKRARYGAPSEAHNEDSTEVDGCRLGGRAADNYRDGCPTFAPAYVGRERWAKPQQGSFVQDRQKSNRNQSFSAHVRSGERGAPVPSIEIRGTRQSGSFTAGESC
jgi:hypothetical protein